MAYHNTTLWEFLNAVQKDKKSKNGGRKEEELTQEDLELLEKKGKIDDADQKRGLRKIFSICIFFLIIIYLVGVYVLLWKSGMKDNGFRLPESVLNVILGTTTINVIGLLYVVVRYLFPNK